MTSSEPSVQSHLQEHIELIARHEQEFLARRSHSERLADTIASWIGSLTFVCAHAVIFTGWIFWNTFNSPSLPHFDPPPFPLLDVLFAFEAILMASFILMRQSRMSRRAEERDHLMLQLLLLTEKETTAVLGVDREMAQTLGLHKIAGDAQIASLSEVTPIDEVARSIQETLPTK